MMPTKMQPRTSAPPLLQMILHWVHAEGGEAHCLARLYRQDSPANDSAITFPCGKGIIVLSAIRSNDRKQALMLDLAGAANAMISSLPAWGINPQLVTWLIHHGAFSDYEPLQQEEWGRVGFLWNGSQYELDWDKWKSLQPIEVAALHQQIELAPVFEVLNQIGWMQR